MFFVFFCEFFVFFVFFFLFFFFFFFGSCLFFWWFCVLDFFVVRVFFFCFCLRVFFWVFFFVFVFVFFFVLFSCCCFVGFFVGFFFFLMFWCFWGVLWGFRTDLTTNAAPNSRAEEERVRRCHASARAFRERRRASRTRFARSLGGFSDRREGVLERVQHAGRMGGQPRLRRRIGRASPVTKLLQSGMRLQVRPLERRRAVSGPRPIARRCRARRCCVVFDLETSSPNPATLSGSRFPVFLSTARSRASHRATACGSSAAPDVVGGRDVKAASSESVGTFDHGR